MRGFNPGSLTSFSQIISNPINNTKDALIKALDNMSDDEVDSLLPLFRQVIYVFALRFG